MLCIHDLGWGEIIINFATSHWYEKKPMQGMVGNGETVLEEQKKNIKEP